MLLSKVIYFIFIMYINKKPIFYTYLLECEDGTIYTGHTWNIFKRLEQHRTGIGGANYTKKHGVFKIIHLEGFLTKEEAYKREWEIKYWDHDSKMALAKGHLDYPQPAWYKRDYKPKINPFVRPNNILSKYARDYLLKELAAS